MAYKEYIVDRAPYICPAGKLLDYSENVAGCLKWYSLEDKVNALMHEKNISDTKKFTYKLPELENFRNAGIYTKLRKLLRPPVRTRFQTLIGDLKETTYKSYWDCLEGKKRDPTGYLPAHIDPYGTTFGLKKPPEPSVKEVVNPDKKYGEVLDEYIKGHELYKKSHNDYYVNEHVDRKYLKPAYNPKRVFGQKTKYDPRGIWMKCCMTAKNRNEFTVGNTVQTEHQKKWTPKLGQCLTPNKNIEQTPEGFTFGVPCRSCRCVAEVLTENKTPKIKTDIEHYMAHINPLRTQLKDRFNRNLFSFSKFFGSLKYYDKNNTEWIPLSTAYEICSCFHVVFDKTLVEEFLTLLGFLKDGQIRYSKFVDILNFQSDFPDISSLYCVPAEKQYYETSYKAAINDYKIIDNSKKPRAGLPVIRYDVSVPVIPIGGCRADMDSFGSETDANTIIYPSIYTAYGLTFFDFFEPREKGQIRCIFTKIGYELNDETFEKLWDEGIKLDKTGSVCIDTFNNLLKTHKIKFKIDKSDTKK